MTSDPQHGVSPERPAAGRSRWRFWAWPGELHRRGILGINRRNADCVMPCNPRKFYPRVDDKVITKGICQQRGIPVPKTFAVIERNGDIRKLSSVIEGRQEFVIKPACGSGGRGIVVVARHDGETFHTSSGEEIHISALRYHLSTMLSGLYSLGGQVDRAIVEERIVRHKVFENVAVNGTPDIRIILYRYVPVMAMIRLPTVASRGRANLHQGAVAAAINLHTGRTFGGVCKSRAISAHPDTGASIEGLAVPAWEELLSAAMNLAEGLELGYVGVDFVLGISSNPVVLEANARPGLAIQVAHRRGLVPRLNMVDAHNPESMTPDYRRELIAKLAAVE